MFLSKLEEEAKEVQNPEEKLQMKQKPAAKL